MVTARTSRFASKCCRGAFDLTEFARQRSRFFVADGDFLFQAINRLGWLKLDLPMDLDAQRGRIVKVSGRDWFWAPQTPSLLLKA